MALNKDAILAAADLQSRSVDVAEWGGSVNIRELSAKDMDAFQASIRDADGKLTGNIVEKFLAFTIVDDAGARVFADADFTALAGKNRAVLAKLFDAAQKLNGIGQAAQDEITKN